MPMPYKTSMQFKGVGNLFDDGEFSKSFFSIGKLFKDSNFKKANSISDLQGTVLDNFNKQFHISSDGISEWSKAQIEAKANAIGLTESLKNDLLLYLLVLLVFLNFVTYPQYLQLSHL